MTVIPISIAHLDGDPKDRGFVKKTPIGYLI
jgi:hypothetical protein